MKKCLNNRANHENFDLSRLLFFSKIGLIRRKKRFKNYSIFYSRKGMNPILYIPYFAFTPFMSTYMFEEFITASINSVNLKKLYDKIEIKTSFIPWIFLLFHSLLKSGHLLIFCLVWLKARSMRHPMRIEPNNILEYLELKTIFSQVLTLQGPILALICPWYNNTEQNKRKDNLHVSRTFIPFGLDSISTILLQGCLWH